MEIMAPRDRNGPKGTSSFLFFFLRMINTIPTIEPKSEPKNIVSKTFSHPRKEPTIAISFISPPPMPSRLNIARLNIAVVDKSTTPRRRPLTEFNNVICGIIMLNVKPIIIPGSVMASGIILCSRSIKAMIINEVHRRA